MSYENPPVPHEVNVSRESVLAEFLRLSAGLAICILALSAVLFFAGGWLARFIPFSMESDWIGQRVMGVALLDARATPPAGDSAEILEYLQALTTRLSSRMDLPAEMRIKMHFSESDVPNAFATLGGHVVVTRGLYARMPSENALALVVAHEIAHIKARDPVSAIGGGASLALVLVLIGGDVETLAPQLANVVQLGYSRHAESRADAAALAAVRRLYGHAGGTAAVFEALSEYQRLAFNASAPTLLSTHPADEERIRRMRQAAQDWDTRTPLVPLAVATNSRAQTSTRVDRSAVERVTRRLE